MADFLARDQRPPPRRVVLRRVEIGVVELGGALNDMPARKPDRGDSEPAARAIAFVADEDLAGDRIALPAVGGTCQRPGEHELGGRVPIRNRARDRWGPLGRDRGIDLEPEVRAVAGPMIGRPRVIGDCRGQRGKCRSANQRDSNDGFHVVTPCKVLFVNGFPVRPAHCRLRNGRVCLSRRPVKQPGGTPARSPAARFRFSDSGR